MLRLSIIGVVAVAVILSLPGARSAESDSATIVNSGSTNRPGFRFVVDQSGVAEFTSVARRVAVQAKPIQGMVPHALAERFYAELKAAKPLGSLPGVHCAKSASFGSVLTIAFGGDETPDLSCGDGGNAAMRDLIRDANEIIAVFRDK